MSLRHLLPRLRAALPFSQEFHARRCGHQTASKGLIHAYGESSFVTMHVTGRKTVDYCLDCLEKMTIRCAWCDRPIFIGDEVTLYAPAEGCIVPEHAVVYQTFPMQLVGCLRWDCARDLKDRAGFWILDPNQKGVAYVLRVPTADEMLREQHNSDLASIVGDASDIAEALDPTLVSLEPERSA